MAFTAVAALVAGEAVTAGLVLAAVAEVGMAITVVGAVTGSKDMMKVGGIMSLVGGVGSMVAGAAGSGGAAAADGWVSAEGGAGYAGGAAADAGAMGAAAAADEAVASGGGFAADGSTAFQPQQFGTSTLVNNPPQSNGILSQNMQDAVSPQAVSPQAVPDTTPSLSAGADAPAGPSAPASPFDTQIAGPNDIGMNTSNLGGVQQQADALGSGGQQSSGQFMDGVKKLGGWMEKNKTLAGMMVQVAGSTMSGMAQASAQNDMNDISRRQVAVNEQAQANRSQSASGGGYRSMYPQGRPIISGVMK